jgi:hypothetical protein
MLDPVDGCEGRFAHARNDSGSRFPSREARIRASPSIHVIGPVQPDADVSSIVLEVDVRGEDGDGEPVSYPH